MKPSKKADRKPEEVEKTGNVKKKLAKPWRIEYMIMDEKLLDTYSWFRNTREIGVWLVDPWEKYLSLEHGLKEINKKARSGRFKEQPLKEHWHFAGRDFRLTNIETGQSIALVLGEREIHAEREEGGDSAGSPG